MSYRCQRCGKPERPKTPRKTVYIFREKLTTVYVGGVPQTLSRNEIAQELHVCQGCYTQLESIANAISAPQSPKRRIGSNGQGKDQGS